MAVANNADDYAASRVGIFFPAHNQTPADGNLTGQCVTLVKWFMGEMASVPSPFAARGDARYVGRNLVAQGHAVEVPWDQRRRGDIICYEYGTYGHIAVQLSGGRVFEENVNMPGVNSRVVYGERVYSARIGGEGEGWRAGKNPHVYRLKSYNEPNNPPKEDIVKPSAQHVTDAFRKHLFRDPKPDELAHYQTQDRAMLYAFLMDTNLARIQRMPGKPNREAIIVAYQKYLGENPREEQIAAQMGQESMGNVLESIGGEVEAKRKALEKQVAEGGDPKAAALLKAVREAVN